MSGLYQLLGRSCRSHLHSGPSSTVGLTYKFWSKSRPSTCSFSHLCFKPHSKRTLQPHSRFNIWQKSQVRNCTQKNTPQAESRQTVKNTNSLRNSGIGRETITNIENLTVTVPKGQEIRRLLSLAKPEKWKITGAFKIKVTAYISSFFLLGLKATVSFVNQDHKYYFRQTLSYLIFLLSF